MIKEKAIKEKAAPSPSRAKVLEGVIVSNRPAKTVVVQVDRLIRHRRYGKFIKRSRRYQAHNPGGDRELGERVAIRSCRPYSRHKKFILI